MEKLSKKSTGSGRNVPAGRKSTHRGGARGWENHFGDRIDPQNRKTLSDPVAADRHPAAVAGKDPGIFL